MGNAWRRPLATAVSLSPADGVAVAGTLRHVTWLERAAGSEARCGLEVTLAVFQKAFDAGWFGLGLGSVEPGSEWSFTAARPVELVLVLDAATTARLATLAPDDRLTALADGLAGQGSGPDLRAAPWHYASVLQEQGPGVRAGFDRRAR
jgi:hypothetical protein